MNMEWPPRELQIQRPLFIEHVAKHLGCRKEVYAQRNGR